MEHWEYLHPFVEGDRFTRLGDGSACPYFWPIGNRHILLIFSHLTGQYLLGGYDRERDKFVVDSHGLCNFGAAFPGVVYAPTAVPDGRGGVIVLFNMNAAKPTNEMGNYLGGFFGEQAGEAEAGGDAALHAQDWDQILTLRNPYELHVEPTGDRLSAQR